MRPCPSSQANKRTVCLSGLPTPSMDNLHSDHRESQEEPRARPSPHPPVTNPLPSPPLVFSAQASGGVYLGPLKPSTTGGSLICGTPNCAPGKTCEPEGAAPTNHPTPSSSQPPPHCGFRSGVERGFTGFPQTRQPREKPLLRNPPPHSCPWPVPFPRHKVKPTRNCTCPLSPLSLLPNHKHRGKLKSPKTQPPKTQSSQ